MRELLQELVLNLSYSVGKIQFSKVLTHHIHVQSLNTWMCNVASTIHIQKIYINFFILEKMSNIPHNEIGDWTCFNLPSGSLYLSFDITCYLVLVKQIFKTPYPFFSVFPNYLPFEGVLALHLNNLESSSPRVFVPRLVEIGLVVLEKLKM